MCASFCFLDFDNLTFLQILEQMSRTMTHRGPDGEGCNINQSLKGRIGLGHTRLSIINLREGGNQPMHFQNLHITFKF